MMKIYTVLNKYTIDILLIFLTAEDAKIFVIQINPHPIPRRSGAGFYSGEKFLYLCAPRINIESNPSYDIMTILQFKPEINDRVKLFTRIQMLNLFNSGRNIRFYQWMRLGLEVKGLQFGLAATRQK